MYLLAAVILACKFGTCYYLSYQEQTNSPTACITLQTRIYSIANAEGYINPHILSCTVSQRSFQWTPQTHQSFG